MRRATLKTEVVDVLNGKKLIKSLKEKSLFNEIPEVKPLSLKAGALIFGGITLLGMALSITIGTFVFFGAITLAGLIAIIESNKYFKYFVVKSNRLLDLLIFAFTINATVSLGVMMTASLTFAGLGYTLVYAPWLRLNNK